LFSIFTPDFFISLRLILPVLRGKDESFVNGIKIHRKGGVIAGFIAGDKARLIHNVECGGVGMMHAARDFYVVARGRRGVA
jgi:hypothetical protein